MIFRSMKCSLAMLAVVFTTHAAFAQLPKVEPPRAWTGVSGVAFTATLLNFDGTTAIFKMANGQQAKATAAQLSVPDQEHLAAWLKRQPIKFTMPDVVAVDTAKITITTVSEDDKAEKYVYRTNHFEFQSPGKFNGSLMREISRTFEATYELLRALPWGIDPRPPSGTHFRAELFKTKEAYVAAGGPPNSGGVYKSATETFYVPFESIGIKEYGKGYSKDDDFNADTLVHELTHQMMHFWLPYLPNWVVEGTAEYTGNLPLKTGRFRVSAAKSALKDYTEFLKKRAVGGMPEPYDLYKLFKITNEQWGDTLAEDPTLSRRMYFTSYLLVYYFMHLDGNGDGQRFIKFFREVDAMRKSGGRGMRSDAEYQTKILAILLDGRSEDELMKQIRSAYAKLGIRL